MAWKQGHPNNNKHNLNLDLGFLILVSPRWARTPWRKVWSRGKARKGMSLEHHLIPENSKRLKWLKGMSKKHSVPTSQIWDYWASKQIIMLMDDSKTESHGSQWYIQINEYIEYLDGGEAWW